MTMITLHTGKPPAYYLIVDLGLGRKRRGCRYGVVLADSGYEGMSAVAGLFDGTDPTSYLLQGRHTWSGVSVRRATVRRALLDASDGELDDLTGIFFVHFFLLNARPALCIPFWSHPTRDLVCLRGGPA